MRNLILILFFAVFALTAKGQANYSADLIPKELLSYASAITRDYDATVKIISKNDVLYHYKIVQTILNNNGDKYAGLEVWHNRSRSIKFIKGVIYDEYGKPTGKITESNFTDDNYYDGATMFEDIRIKHYKPGVTTYPYTVEYTYEVHEKQSLNIDSWRPIRGQRIALQQSTYTVICPADLKLQIKEINYPGNGVAGVNDDKMKTYSWHVSNVNALRDEPFSPNEKLYTTNVEVAPQDFMYEGIAGNYNNWDSLGKWIYDKLLIGRTQIPPETVEEMAALTKDISSPKDKARKIYEYMQNKTRYISIQIGIGGYQPFLAADVDRLSYGDCKGLVNYTQALLKAVNIDSYYCVVKSGGNKASLMTDFASMGQADHVILCLPFKNDTTWLECTSKTMPFGFLGGFTDDRTVLACTPQGGKLMHTPRYTAQQNEEDKKAGFTLTEDGTLTGDMSTTFTGRQYEYRDRLLNETYKDQLKSIKKDYPINNMEIESLSFKPEKKEIPIITEIVKLKAPEYASAENGRLLFMVNVANRTGEPIHEARNRLTPLYINRGFTDDDNIIYTLPAGYVPDKHLLNINLHKNFGTYKASVSVNGNQLTYTRKLQLIDGTYTKEAYNELVDFYQSVYDADHYTMTLVKDKQ